uniref:Uncharacterized protein n=1 Tax=Brassica oleracea var. oleracea TaxID=109376 RepID=A0A0D3BVR1_BRAOL
MISRRVLADLQAQIYTLTTIVQAMSVQPFPSTNDFDVEVDDAESKEEDNLEIYDDPVYDEYECESEEDLYKEIYGPPIFDIYEDDVVGDEGMTQNNEEEAKPFHVKEVEYVMLTVSSFNNKKDDLCMKSSEHNCWASDLWISNASSVTESMITRRVLADLQAQIYTLTTIVQAMSVQPFPSTNDFDVEVDDAESKEEDNLEIYDDPVYDEYECESEEDLYKEIYGPPIFDIYEDDVVGDEGMIQNNEEEAKPFHVKEVEYVMLTVSSFNNKKDDLSHCLDLMLEDIGKLEPVKNALKKCIFMSGYIYCRVPLVNMMRRFTNQHNLHRPAAKKLKRYILQESFWRNVAYALKLTGPLVKVLSMVDGDTKPAMGYIYAAMDRAKEAIARTGYFLNPAIHYANLEDVCCEEVETCLYNCINRLVPDGEIQDKVLL